MADENKLHQDASKAARAQALLNNEMLVEGWEKIEADLIAGWIASSPHDVEIREAAFRMIHANRKHRDFLHLVMRDGKLAAVELKQLAASTERKQRFGII